MAETIPEGLEYVDSSASPFPAKVEPGRGDIVWTFSAPITDGVPITLQYDVKPQTGITLPTTSTFVGLAVLTDTSRATIDIPIPSSVLTITEPCVPFVTPTTTPTATDIPPTPTATPTHTPTSTSTPVPQPIHFPISLNEYPCTREQRADVVLVMDASSSMNEPAGDGRTKLEAARSAAVAFIDRLKLDAGDQAAVVAFNSDAATIIGLGSDPSALEEALVGITTASQTCLVCGLEAAGEVLESEARLEANQPVIILLTDGRSNPRPVSEAVAEADRLKSDGAVIFTIGLGADLDDAALSDIASKPAFAYRASDGGALEAIYREIAVTLPGPADCYWGRRP